MPRGDRTGPNGIGPRTGRGLGYCAGYDTPGYVKSPGLGRAWGRGGGMGRGGFGYGRGWDRGYRVPFYTQYPPPIVSRISTENQITMFKQEKEYLESEMNNIKIAIDEISKKITEFEKEE